MENFFSNLFGIISDRTISFSKRTLFILSIIFIIYIVNDTFNFSFNYRINQKINQLKELNEFYDKTPEDSARLKNNFLEIEREIMSRKPLISKVKNMYFNLLNNTVNSNQKNILFRILSGSALFIIFMILIPFIETNRAELKTIYLGLLILAIVFNLLLFLIPTFENINYNHGLNIGISIIIFALLSFYGNSLKK